ncbi:MAG: OmpA family protein, partial [Desulfobacteraceae bacterium]
MNRSTLIWMIGILGWLAFPYCAVGQADVGMEASIVIHFKSGKAFLGAGDKAKLREFFQKHETGPGSRIFVVGYTDSVGDKQYNYTLSRKRAQSIRREIISDFGIDKELIMAVGKGEENPIGDNLKAAGRSSNRRAEIYLVNTKARKGNRLFGPDAPYSSEIETLVRQAQALIKQRRLAEAMKILKKAQGLGGDHYSDWHSTYGIAGYYANAPLAEINAHLTKALELDPYNYMAREYLGRTNARQKVASREITPEMGLSTDHAIGVTSVAQQYEYLRLFDVEPQVHRTLDGRPLDIWECVNSSGAPVVYYFDHSRIYDWAFAKRSDVKRPPTIRPDSFKISTEGTPAPIPNPSDQPEEAAPSDPKKI